MGSEAKLAKIRVSPESAEVPCVAEEICPEPLFPGSLARLGRHRLSTASWPQENSPEINHLRAGGRRRLAKPKVKTGATVFTKRILVGGETV